MKKLARILALTLSLAMALFLVACGNTAAPAEEETAEETEAAETEETEATEATAGAEGLKIGATYYSLQNEFTMRMDNQAKKWAEANGVSYTGYDGDYNAETQLQQVETMIGIRPIETSSISSSFGVRISARPMASICCSPPLIVRASCP